MARSRILITHYASLITLLAAAAPAQIVINEIEYDQSAGTDTAEFIELFEANQSGMSLAGWQLILYNGTASQRRPYRTIELAAAPGGVMPADGYLVIGPSPAVPNVDIAPDMSNNWIRNGSPDGMALVHNGVVIELLAYEGTFDANTNGTGGPAAGMTFPNIGVSEDGGDGIGLQRIPDGGTWTEVLEVAATPGGSNPNGDPPIPVGRLVLMHRGDANSGPIGLCATGGVPPYTFSITGLPANGQLSHAGGVITGTPTVVSGELRYTPNSGFSGLDQFSFRVRDALSTVSNSVVQEVAVQAGGVVISEVMHSPSGDWRVYSFVEIYNLGPAVVALGRLDASRSTMTDTTNNLVGHSIPAGQTRIIAPDATDTGADPDAFRCEWNLREADIIRVPLSAFETMFSAPDDSDCSLSDGSRILLFDSAGALLDTVDLGLIGLPASAAGQSLAIHDGFLVPAGPLDTRNNDAAGPWFNAGTAGVPGVRWSYSSDRGGPMIVPGLSDAYVPGGDCYGKCCIPEEPCQELTEDDCAKGGGDVGAWVAGSTCGFVAGDTPAFIVCLSGPGASLGSGCGEWNQDGDADVDLQDGAAFQAAFVESPCP